MSIFFRTQRGRFYGRWNGKTYALEPDRASSERRFAQIRGEIAPDEVVVRVPYLSELLAEYLSRAKLAVTTKVTREKVFARFRKYWDGPVDDLTADRIHKWFDKCDLNDTSKSTIIGMFKSALNWLADNGTISKNPIKRMPKPTPDRRERRLEDHEVQTMLRMAKEPFRTVLVLGLETGMRTQELLALEGRHVVEPTKIIFQASEAKTRKKARVVWLNDRAAAIVAELKQKHPIGKLLRNSRNIAWTKDSLRQRMEPIANELGWKVRVTDCRHRFASDRIAMGQDPVFVAKLLGHSNVNMVYRIYGHLEENSQLMTAAVNFGKSGP